MIKMDQELNNLEVYKLNELDSMKSRFFNNISHELKTPLTLIMGPIEHLLKKTTDTSDQSSLLMIQRNARQLQEYINEILELSKIEANKLKLNTKKLEVVKFIKSIIKPFEFEAQKKHISLNITSVHDNLICYLDPNKFDTIIANLISNAIKFTPNGGSVQLSISGCSGNKHEHCTQKEGCVIITVEDTGIGISDDKLPSIFDKYYRVDKNFVDHEYGTGLGLALVRELVSLHKGTINVESKEGVFTKFIIRFPFGHYHLKTDEFFDNCIYKNVDNQEIFADKNQTDNTDSELDAKIILVIEDYEDMRTIIRTGLKHEYTIIEAKDGEEGTQLAIETLPNLILCDVSMPKKNGFEVCKALKSNEMTNHIPIILLTGKDTLSDKLTGLEIGADDYLLKPFFINELKARVKNILDRRELLKDKYSTQSILQLNKLPNKSIDQIFLEKVTTIIESHIADEDFSVQLLMKEMCMSRTPLHRKLKALVNKSANELIQSIRLQKASEMLKSNTASVSEIGYLVGFPSPPYFSRVFKQYYGHTPSEHSNSLKEISN